MSGTKTDDIEAMVDGWLADSESTPATEGTPTEGTPDAPTADPPKEEGAPQPDGEVDPNKQTEQRTGEPGKPAGDQKPAAQQAPKAGPGDLVDRDGRVVARAGAERRHYEAAQRATRELTQTRGELERINTELNAFRQAAQLPTQLGLSPDESTVGLQLVASWKQNPVGVIQYLVEQAKAAGHNLDTLGGTTDMAAIRAMIAQEFAPIRQQSQAVQQQTEMQNAARQQVEHLVTEYGDQAMVNSDALAKLIDAAGQANKPLTLEQAYLRFSNWCLGNGYDPHQPIDPQIAAKQQAPQPQQPANQQRNPPRPNGRAVAAPNGVVPMDSASRITGTESTRDLVREAMREAGYNL